MRRAARSGSTRRNSALLEKEYLVEIVRGPDGKPLRKLLDEFPGAEDLPGCTKTF